MEQVCRTIGELKAALSDLHDDLPIVSGLADAVGVRTAEETNAGTGITRQVAVIEEPDFDDEEEA